MTSAEILENNSYHLPLSRSVRLCWLLSICCAMGGIILQREYTGSRAHDAGAVVLMLLGLGVIYGPVVALSLTRRVRWYTLAVSIVAALNLLPLGALLTLIGFFHTGFFHGHGANQ